MKATIVIENPPTKATRNAKSGTVRVMTREMTTNANRMETFRGPHSFPIIIHKLNYIICSIYFVFS